MSGLEGKRKEWVRDCMFERGRILKGEYCHWCNEWDFLTMDETCDEWPCGCAVSDAALRK
jgi:hypothetical protein